MQADGQTLVTYTGMTRIVIFLQVNYTDLTSTLSGHILCLLYLYSCLLFL